MNKVKLSTICLKNRQITIAFKACTGNVKKVNNNIFTNAINYDTICTLVNLSSVEDVKNVGC